MTRRMCCLLTRLPLVEPASRAGRGISRRMFLGLLLAKPGDQVTGHSRLCNCGRQGAGIIAFRKVVRHLSWDINGATTVSDEAPRGDTDSAF
jgi:hypothetical protein